MGLGNDERAQKLARLHMTREPDFTVSMFRDMRTRIRISKPGIYETYYKMLSAAGIPE